jgi:hypothetical protein
MVTWISSFSKTTEQHHFQVRSAPAMKKASYRFGHMGPSVNKKRPLGSTLRKTPEKKKLKHPSLSEHQSVNIFLALCPGVLCRIIQSGSATSSRPANPDQRRSTGKTSTSEKWKRGSRCAWPVYPRYPCTRDSESQNTHTRASRKKCQSPRNQ